MKRTLCFENPTEIAAAYKAESKDSGTAKKIRQKYGASEKEQSILAEAYFTEYESWSRMPGNEVPCGAPKKVIEKYLSRGHANVVARLQENPPAGVALTTIAALMSITYYLFKFINWFFDTEDGDE